MSSSKFLITFFLILARLDIFTSFLQFFLMKETKKTPKSQGRSEGTSKVAFEVLIINCKLYFTNSFIFNCLTLNIKLFIFKLFDVKCLSQTEEDGCLWSYGCASLILDFELTRENDDLLSSRHK